MEEKFRISYKSETTLNTNVIDDLKTLINRFEFLLQFLSSKEDFDKEKFSQTLEEKLNENITLNDYTNIALENLINSKLKILIKKAFLSLLEINPELLADELTNYNVVAKKSLRSRLHLMYYWASSLENQFGKEKTLELFKEYIDRMTESGLRPIKKVEHLSKLVSSSEDFTGEFKDGFDLIAFKLDEGRVGMKISRCKWIEVLSEIADPDYMYAIACHYDFLAVTMMNPNFELTRTTSLGSGGKCCDFIWHDKRFDSQVRHENEDFWKTIQ
ncbi:MAG: L-2-amino-thiazoline-4-carboxylic acid hydrolase [Pseudomonadota bacterium]